MLNRMDVGTIPGKAILMPTYHLLKMSRCDICGQNNHATKLLSTQTELMWFWRHNHFACKSHIYPFWVNVKLAFIALLGIVPTPIRLRIVGSTGWGIWVDVILVGQKITWQKCFSMHETGGIDGGRGFQTRGNVFWIGGNTFYDRKNKVQWKFQSSKDPESK